MSFNIMELLSWGGRPISLYEFTWGATVWRYTSADRIVNFEGEDWLPIAISDNGQVQGASDNNFIVTLPRSLPMCDLFRLTPPATSIWLKARKFHRDDPDEEGIVYWVGLVSNIKGKNAIQAEAIGLPISGTLRRTGLRLCWERNCPYAVYDNDCRVDKELFKTVTTITAIDGNEITVASVGAFTGPQYNGGFLEWEASVEGTIDRRGIEEHLGGLVFRLFGTADRLTLGLEISMYLGCDLTTGTCNGTFDNLAQHGGWRFLPGKSPFEGDQVF